MPLNGDGHGHKKTKTISRKLSAAARRWNGDGHEEDEDIAGAIGWEIKNGFNKENIRVLETRRGR